MPSFKGVLLRHARPCSQISSHDALERVLPVTMDLAMLELAQWQEAFNAGLAADADALVTVSESPLPFAPSLRRNRTVVHPASRKSALKSVLNTWRESAPADRNLRAYLRQHALGDLPGLAAALTAPLQRVRRLVNSTSNTDSSTTTLWLGDGRLGSALHYDDRDNLLLQLLGEKRIPVGLKP